MIMEALDYILQNKTGFIEAWNTHVLLALSSLFIACVLSIPLALMCYLNPLFRKVVLLLNHSLRVIPSVAILTLCIPIMGTGKLPAVFALTILAIPPVLIHTYVGLTNVRREYIEAGLGLGLTERQLFMKIQWPLMAPLVYSGIQISAIEVIGSGTLAAFIGGGGLGTFIVSGLSLYSFPILLAGAAPVALMAISVELISTYSIKNSKKIGG